MSEQVIQLKATLATKIIMIVIVLLAFTSSWFVVRWYLGNTLAEYLLPEQNQLETAQMAVSWAPNDPLPHWRLAKLIQTSLPSDQIPLAVAEYEKAVSLSPNDYRFWMDLGAALEQAGDSERAEKVLRQAVKLAPSYSYPSWHLGNLLLREGRYPEAFAELRRASEANDELRPQLFNLAWQVNKDDFEALLDAIGKAPETRAQLSQYLFSRGKFDEGLRLWNSLTEGERKANRAAALSMIDSLIAAKRYHQAMEIWNSVAPETAQTDMGHISDGGFEENLGQGAGVFSWQYQSTPQAQTGIDTNVARADSHSFKIVFQVRSRLEAINFTQLVPVQPNTQYDLDYYLKTDKLVSAATPVVAILDAADESPLVSSAAAPNGDNDWQRISLSFKTGTKTEAVRLKISPTSCTDNSVCPIFGTVWYDDFELKSRK
ncbi:MAG TPA: tetratricopeptide repeat protein [Pyrinomonadaceae bacterium]|nr:tetratricopeptide repeat protein [Pyrinomonadaceae bacterium]